VFLFVSRNVHRLAESLGSDRRVLKTRVRMVLSCHERDIAEYSEIRRKLRQVRFVPCAVTEPTFLLRSAHVRHTRALRSNSRAIKRDARVLGSFFDPRYFVIDLRAARGIIGVTIAYNYVNEILNSPIRGMMRFARVSARVRVVSKVVARESCE